MTSIASTCCAGFGHGLPRWLDAHSAPERRSRARQASRSRAARPLGGRRTVILQSLANLGEFIGGIGVVITLVYLALQIRQNTAALRTASRQQVAAGFREYQRAFFDPAVARAFAVGARTFPDMPFEERSRFGAQMTDHALFFQGAFALYEAGQLEAETYRAYLEWFVINLSLPGGAAWWSELGRPFFTRRMVAAVEARLALGEIPDISDAYFLRLDEPG